MIKSTLKAGRSQVEAMQFLYQHPASGTGTGTGTGTDRQQATPKPKRDGACQLAGVAEQANHRPAPAPAPAPAWTPAEPPPRVDRVLFLEGHRAAKDLIRSMAASLSTREGATAVLDRLRGIALASPASYAAGVLEVVDQVETLLNRGEV